MRNIQLRSIDAIMAKEQEDLERSIANLRENLESRKRQIELNFQAAALLDGAGIDLEIPEWSQLYTLNVYMGDKPTLKKQWRERDAFIKALNTIRQALECPLKLYNKRPCDDGKRVEVTLCPVEFPNVRVHYYERLPRGSKCKIVTHRYKTKELVCEV